MTSMFTVWKDGTWLRQDSSSDHYAQQDPNWLVSIPINDGGPVKPGADKLLHRDLLLSELATALKALQDESIRKGYKPAPLCNLKVTLYKGAEELYEILGADEALHELVEGLYWNEEADWSEADHLIVGTY